MQPVHESNLRTFVGLIKDIEQFNRNYSPHSLLGRALQRGLQRAISGEDADSLSPRQPTAPGSERHANEIFQNYVKCLSSIGLDLVQNRLDGLKRRLALEPTIDLAKEFLTPPDPYRSQKLEVALVDEERLLRFLRSITSDGVKDVGAADALNSLAHSLSNELLEEYVFQLANGDSKKLASLIKSLSLVVTEFERLDQKSATEELSDYLRRARQGNLREYLQVIDKGLLGSGFGPHNWHLDSTAEVYRDLWQGAFALIEEINENPRALDLSRTVLSQLKVFADSARNEIMDKLRGAEERNEYWNRFGPDKLKVLDWVESELRRFD